MSDDNVKPLPSAAGLPDNPLALTQQKPGWCGHDAVLIDEHTRTLSCAKCGAALDPFEFLRSNAKTIETAWSHYRMVQRQANEVAERVHQLKKEEQRLRAMVKRLQEKTGAVLSVRGKGSL